MNSNELSRIGKSNGEKRRFGAAGITNAAASNLVLQALLAMQVPIAISTLLAQAFNTCFGYISYGKYAFKASVRDHRAAIRYGTMACLLWFTNWGGIKTMETTGISKSTGALIMILPLAIVSFTIQQRWVFRKP